MNKLTDWIKRHPVIAFYLIAYAVTWGFRNHISRARSLLPAVDRLEPCHGGAGCLCDRLNALADSTRKENPLFVNPSARRVGLVSPGVDTYARASPAFDPD